MHSQTSGRFFTMLEASESKFLLRICAPQEASRNACLASKWGELLVRHLFRIIEICPFERPFDPLAQKTPLYSDL